jgi:hypothetical protein
MDKKTSLILYCSLLEEFKRRRAVIADVLTGRAPLPAIVAAELCYLQLRIMCELLALACLVAHGDIEATRTGRMNKKYEADWIMNALEHLHPGFYPVPGQQVVKNGVPVEVRKIESGYLTKADLLVLYHECGENLHRGSLKSVLSESPDTPDFSRIQQWDEKFRVLLNHHQIQLIDPKHQVWVLMQGGDGRVHAAEMTALSTDALRDSEAIHLGRGISMNDIDSRLHPINSVSCGPTAVCAVTGATSPLVLEKMMEAIDFDGPRPSHLNDSAFRHQCRAIELLGFDLFDTTGEKIDASVLPMNPPITAERYNAAHTVAEFVNSNDLDDVVIGFAADTTTGVRHTFAADRRWFFDNNTGGLVADSAGIDPQIQRMKVMEVFRLRRRA